MLIRISLIVAIIAGLAVGAINFVKVKEQIEKLQTELASEKTAKEQAQAAQRKTQKDLDTTKAELTQTKETLASETAAKEKAVADAAAAVAKAESLNANLKETLEKLGAAQAELASYKASGMSPEQVANAAKQINQLQAAINTMQTENKLLGQKIRTLNAELMVYRSEEPKIPLPKGLKGEVVQVDPKWDFVVLNVGIEQGVLEHSELLVSRNGKLVGKIKVRSTDKNRSIANVMPGWKQTELMEGDEVIPAYPES
jgi:hypothetical protein